jgi:hypothetical protein
VRTAAQRDTIERTLSELETGGVLRGLPAGLATATMAAMQEATMEFIAKQPKQRVELIERACDLNRRLCKDCGNCAHKSKKAASRQEISTIHDVLLDDAPPHHCRSVETLSFAKPRRTLLTTRSSCSMWNRFTILANEPKMAFISSRAKWIPAHR